MAQLHQINNNIMNTSVLVYLLCNYQNINNKLCLPRNPLMLVPPKISTFRVMCKKKPIENLLDADYFIVSTVKTSKSNYQHEIQDEFNTDYNKKSLNTLQMRPIIKKVNLMQNYYDKSIQAKPKKCLSQESQLQHKFKNTTQRPKLEKQDSSIHSRRNDKFKLMLRQKQNQKRRTHRSFTCSNEKNNDLFIAKLAKISKQSMEEFNHKSIDFIKKLQKQAKMSKFSQDQAKRNRIYYRTAHSKRSNIKNLQISNTTHQIFRPWSGQRKIQAEEQSHELFYD